MKFSIRSKLIVFTCCIVSLVGGSIALYSIYQGRQRILAASEEEARDATSFIAANIVNALYALDLRRLRDELKTARINPDVRYTYAADADGILLTDGTGGNLVRGRKFAEQFGFQLDGLTEWRSRLRDGNIEITGPVAMPDGTRVGYLHIGFSLESAHRAIRHSTITSLSITLICLSIGTLFVIYLSSSFSGPILSMAGAAKKIGEGNLDTRVKINRRDELGELSSSINRMAESLELRYRELEALREIDRAIMSTLDLRNVLDVLLKKIDLVLPYSATAIRLFNKETGDLEPVACWNLDEKEWKAQKWAGGRGIPNVVFETKSPMILRNVLADPNIRDAEFFLRHGLVSYLGVPLIVQEDTLGVMSFYTKEEHEFSRHEIEFLTTLAGQAAIAIHNSQLYEEAVTRQVQLGEAYRHLQSTYKLAVTSSESLDLDATLTEAIRQFTEVFNFDSAEIFISNRRTERVELKASFGSPLTRKDKAFAPGEGVVGKVAASGEALVFDDVLQDARYRQTSETQIAREKNFRFFGVFPMRSKHRTVGVIACIGRAPRSLTPNEMQALNAITAQLGIAVENATLYQEAVQKNQELERANRVKDEFLSVMSHELRTPISVVIGYVGMVAEGMLGEVNEKQREALEKVLTRARDQINMVSSILQATQLECQEVTLERRPLNVADLLDSLRREYTLPARKKITIQWEYSRELPVISTDPDKLKQVLLNLIDNAVKFTEKGGITVSARMVKPAAGNGRPQEENSTHVSPPAPHVSMEFQVSDTGIGIPEDMLPVIFEKFKQIDSSETRLYGGVGLGLYIVKNFTNLLGGEVAVQSEVGKGTTFTVRLPCES